MMLRPDPQKRNIYHLGMILLLPRGYYGSVFFRLEALPTVSVCPTPWGRVRFGILWCLSLLWRVRNCAQTLREVNSLFASNWESRYTGARYPCFSLLQPFLFLLVRSSLAKRLSALNSAVHYHLSFFLVMQQYRLETLNPLLVFSMCWHETAAH